jgi:hypothetical protein
MTQRRTPARQGSLPNLALMDQGAPSARGAGVRVRPPAVHRPPRPSDFFSRTKSICLRRGPHDSGMTGPIRPAWVGGGRGSVFPSAAQPSPDRATRGLNGRREDARVRSRDGKAQSSTRPVLGRRLPWVGQVVPPLRIERVDTNEPLPRRGLKLGDQWRHGRNDRHPVPRPGRAIRDPDAGRSAHGADRSS